MHGNVDEWCNDFWGDYDSENLVLPSETKGDSQRVCRGGSWGGKATSCRSNGRGAAAPVQRTNYLGFRVALDATNESPH